MVQISCPLSNPIGSADLFSVCLNVQVSVRSSVLGSDMEELDRTIQASLRMSLSLAVLLLSNQSQLNILRCFIAPVAYGLFLGVAQLFLTKPDIVC